MNVNANNFGQVFTGNDTNGVFSNVSIKAMSKEEFVEEMEKNSSKDEAAVSEISKEGKVKLLDALGKDGKIHIEMTDEQKAERQTKELAFRGMIQSANANKALSAKDLKSVHELSKPQGAPILNDYDLMLGSVAADFREERDSEEYYGLSQRAEDITKAYAKTYEDIVKGYESGTRKAYAIDETSETGYRLMTMEEELAELDKAYEKSAESIQSRVDYSAVVATALKSYAEQLAKAKRGVNAEEVRKEHEKYTKELETLPKDLGDKMKNVAELFKENFKTTNKLSMDFVNTLMKSNYYVKK